jgi:pimeloyl-ACP methyl ester carboxylesterase
MLEDLLKLEDGRVLGYGLYGNPHGAVILDFHGIPGSRREAALIESFLGRDDLCFVGFDRPGYGRSSPKRNYRITDIPADVTELADALDIKRFIALGYSGGGPFALACGRQMPERIAALGIVSGVGPSEIGSAGMHESNRKKFNLAQRLPGLARLMLMAAFGSMHSHPERLPQQLRRIWQQMPEPDRKALEDPRFAEGILELTKDAILNRVTGWANEEILMAQPWGFVLPELRCPNIHLWHGELDRNVPIAMGRAVAERLPECQANFLAGEGHLSLLYNHAAQIVETLLQAAQRPD